MSGIRAVCNAKVNLYLRVKARRRDGFHEIETIYHSITLHDVVTVTPTEEESTVSSDAAGVPLDRTNLALCAATSVLTQAHGGVHIEIDKGIAIGSGLGGGSADAAGALVCVNRLYDLGYSAEGLEKLAEKLGSDVKFMIRGGCAAGTGRGEELEPLPPLPSLPLVLVIPPISVSTAWAYDSLKMRLTRGGTQFSMIASALRNGDVASLCDLLENDFEDLIFDRFPVVRSAKEELVRCGAGGVLMSGSGPAVYGIFLKVGDAEGCCSTLQREGLNAIVSNLTGHGVTITG